MIIFAWTLFLLGLIIAGGSAFAFIRSFYREHVDRYFPGTLFCFGVIMAGYCADIVFGGGR